MTAVAAARAVAMRPPLSFLFSSRYLFALAGAILAALLLPALALAQEEDAIVTLTATVDQLWIVMAGALVFFMHGGFTLVETGFTRTKNAANICAKNLMNMSVGLISYWAIGWAFMYGDTAGGVIGSSDFLIAVGDSQFSTDWFFQVVFAATAATIVSGAMAERTHFRAYLIYAVVLTGFIYPVVGHWVWGGGWLAELGFWDFAGSTVVHTTGGVAALVGAAILGPRLGKYSEDGSVNVIPGHSIPLAIAGVIILWFGWFGFNGGSTLSAVGQDFASVIVVTNLAAAAGAIAAMAVSWLYNGKPDVGMIGNGALAGLVAITAPCSWVDAWAAVIIGLVGGGLVVVGVTFIDKVLKVDDPVGAIAVHGVVGIWGTLAVGLFADPKFGGPEGSLFINGDIEQLAVQALGSAASIVWVGATCLVLFLGIKYTVGLRAEPVEELDGLDIHEHGVFGYGESNF